MVQQSIMRRTKVPHLLDQLQSHTCPAEWRSLVQSKQHLLQLLCKMPRFSQAVVTPDRYLKAYAHAEVQLGGLDSGTGLAICRVCDLCFSSIYGKE